MDRVKEIEIINLRVINIITMNFQEHEQSNGVIKNINIEDEYFDARSSESENYKPSVVLSESQE